MTPLCDRIAGALQLQPMTVAELARCLSVCQQTIRRAIADAPVKPAGSVRGRGKPWTVWKLVA